MGRTSSLGVVSPLQAGRRLSTAGLMSSADCASTVDGQTPNGPVFFSGQGGDVELAAVNGPVALKLLSDIWNGTRLEANVRCLIECE
jgi:hypothetical protein